MPRQSPAMGLLWSKQFRMERMDGAGKGKYPFATWVNVYLEAMKGAYSDTTIEDRRRLYMRMQRELMHLENEGRITTTNPMNLTMNDIGAIVHLYRNMDWKPSSVRRAYSALSNLLLFVGNPAFTMYQLRHPAMFVGVADKRLPSLEPEFVKKLLAKANTVNDDDWPMLRAYALVSFAIGTGSRTKELRLAQISDLDLDEGVFHAEHVKGERTWGQTRDIPIRPEILPLLRRYVEARARELSMSKNGSTALFPALYDMDDGYLSANTVRKVKSLVEQEVGQHFDFRTCRRTYGQMLIDEGNSIETVSVTLGHATSRTTENYYCRRKQKAAIEETKRIWSKQSDAPQNPQNNSIRFKEYMSGYG